MNADIKPWKERVKDSYGREYDRDIDKANDEIAELRAALEAARQPVAGAKLAAYRWPDGPGKFYYQDATAPVGVDALKKAELLYTPEATGNSTPWSTRPESNTITLNYSFASAILGALFNGPTLNPTAHERIKQDFAAVMRGDKVPHAQQTKCEWDQDDPDSREWHTGCSSHWIFNEGGPEENSMIFCHGCGKPIAIASSKGDTR